MNKILHIGLWCLLTQIVIQAQQTPVIIDPRSSEQSEPSTIIMEADIGQRRVRDGVSIDTLRGHVVLTQDSLVMYCHRAIVKDQKHANAYGEVIIVHEDSVQIFADSMIYDGDLRIAELFGEVILQEGERRLYTDHLIYDVHYKKAHYSTGGTLIEGVDTLISKEGYYYQRLKEVFLKGNITFRDTAKQLFTDSILYLYDRDQLNLLGPTRMQQKEVSIYCESGIYQPRRDRGLLSQNVQVVSGAQQMTSEILTIDGAAGQYTFLIHPEMRDSARYATGDTIVYWQQHQILEITGDALYQSADEMVRSHKIVYDQRTEEYKTVGKTIINGEDAIISAQQLSSLPQGQGTLLTGDVQINNVEEGILLQSEIAVHRDSISKLYADSSGGQPMLTYDLRSDTLILRADTLTAIRSQSVVDDTVYRSTIFTADDGVKFMSSGTIGRSDNFHYDQRDSLIILTGDPIIWADSIQLTADTIKIYLRNKSVDQIVLAKNAMIVSPDPQGQLNQIKGLNIDNYLKNKVLSSSYVDGNAELFYMILQDSSYQGINVTKSNEMTFFFEDEDISNIEMLGNPDSHMYPYLEGMEVDGYYLEGFRWRIRERPEQRTFVY